jgi:hypothetical protein
VKEKLGVKRSEFGAGRREEFGVGRSAFGAGKEESGNFIFSISFTLLC